MTALWRGQTTWRDLTDLEADFEPVILAGRAGDSAALMLTGPETVGYASVVTERASVGDIVAIEEFAHPDEEYPTIAIESGKAAAAPALRGRDANRAARWWRRARRLLADGDRAARERRT